MPTSSERKIVKDPYLGRHSIRKSSSLVDLWSILATFATFEKHLKYHCKALQSVFKRIWSVFK
jgi:hypothetical protein